MSAKRTKGARAQRGWQKSLIFDGGIVEWIISIINLSFLMQEIFEKI